MGHPFGHGSKVRELGSHVCLGFGSLCMARVGCVANPYQLQTDALGAVVSGLHLLAGARDLLVSVLKLALCNTRGATAEFGSWRVRSMRARECGERASC